MHDSAILPALHSLPEAVVQSLPNQAGVCSGPPGGLSAVAEVSALHRLLGLEASARRAVHKGCRHCFPLCAGSKQRSLN